MKKIIKDLPPADSIQVSDAMLDMHSIIGYLASPADNVKVMPGGSESITVGYMAKIAYTIVYYNSKYYAKPVNSNHIGYEMYDSMKRIVTHLLTCGCETFLFQNYGELYDWAKKYK